MILEFIFDGDPEDDDFGLHLLRVIRKMMILGFIFDMIFEDDDICFFSLLLNLEDDDLMLPL